MPWVHKTLTSHSVNTLRSLFGSNESKWYLQGFGVGQGGGGGSLGQCGKHFGLASGTLLS